MKVFTVGAAGAGKTTVCRLLRVIEGLSVLDMDDEIMRLSGVVWPDIPTKVDVIEPQIIKAVCAMPEVLLFYSGMQIDRMHRLREIGFRTVLLDVSEEVLRERHKKRKAEEGWNYSQWIDRNQGVIRELWDAGLFDHVISGEQAPECVAEELLAYARETPSRVTS